MRCSNSAGASAAKRASKRSTKASSSPSRAKSASRSPSEERRGGGASGREKTRGSGAGGRRIGPEELARQRIERDGGAGEPAGTRLVAHPCQDRRVSQVHAVEAADGDGRLARRGGVAQHAHVSAAARGARNGAAGSP